MRYINPQIKNLSKALIAYETRGNKSSKTQPAFLVGEKLRSHLATIMGNVGFRALLLRALALANAEIAWLSAVHVKADGSLEWLDNLDAQVGPEEMAEGSAILFAHLLGLLVAFIGEELTLQLVREVWPKLFPDDLGFNLGDKK